MNEQEALKLAKLGKQDGFKRLYELFAGYLFTVAVRMLNDRSLAEDVLQESFEAAFSSIKDFRGESRLKTWLYAILFRTVSRKNAIRKLEPRISDEKHPESQEFAENLEKKLFIEAGLSKLEDRDRMMILMYYRDDLTCGEIAQINGISESNVKILLFRARKKLESFFQRSNREVSNGMQ
ncbi:MAG: RNA polymerase sigma factor [Candidatus Riflebacteria bacterium]|nr:RNA polymerase sigma factor [Candidatus Riflebacteria bacterium]